MEQASNGLTVWFEDPFWVGVFQRTSAGKLSVCKVTFGAEPKDAEIWAFILTQYDRLSFSPAVEADKAADSRSPKRVQREIRRALRPSGVGTKSQQALKLQQEQQKGQRREARQARRTVEKDRRYALRQEKKREKHRGR